MRNILCYILLLTILAMLLSCGNGYSVSGTTDNFRDGSRIYLKIDNAGEWSVFDSCEIVHGNFIMQGRVDTPFVASLFVDSEPVMPVVVERGDITINMYMNDVEIGGTELNNRLSCFIEQKNSIENRMTEIERREMALILDGHTAESAATLVRDSIIAVGEAMDAYVEGFIRDNYSTLLGPCVFRLLCSTLPYPLITKQIERIVADAPEEFLADDFVKEFISAAKNNMRMMNDSDNNQ